MSDPLAVAEVLKEQRDEWRRKYEAEVKLWEWIQKHQCCLQFRLRELWTVTMPYLGEEGASDIVAVAPDPREAVRKAMEANSPAPS
jgi:hypothetical protein